MRTHGSLRDPLRLSHSLVNIPLIPMPLLTFVLLAAEIALLIKLGQALGGGLLLVEILVTGLIGFVLLRASGRKLLNTRRIIELLSQRPDLRSSKPILSLVYGGILLVIPGLLSDIAGIVLIVRYGLLGGRFTSAPSDTGDSETIDVDFEVQDKGSDEDT